MLFIIEYIKQFINFIKEKLFVSYSYKDDFVPIKKEQEFINFNLYSKTIIIDNNDNNDNDNNDNNITNDLNKKLIDSNYK